MKRGRTCHFLLVLLMLVIAMAPMTATAADDIAAHPNCPICGMDRHQFAHSRMLITYTDGSRFGVCSLHCAALELAYHPGKVPTKIEVADLDGKQLIDAETAIWVIGGKRMGVMTANAKWAFADPAAAKRFVADNGGKIADFEAAMSAAYADMYKDTRMIREKRQRMKKMHSGQMSHGQKTHE